MNIKRYWKMIATLSVIVLTIGTFYIQSSFAASEFPDITFKTVSGSEEELDNLTINASYHEAELYQRVTINRQGSTFQEQLPFYERFFGSSMYPEINRYEKDYRNFMRGKVGGTNLFFEDDSVLVYADVMYEGYNHNTRITDYSFNIDVLDKQAVENHSTELSVPNGNDYAWISVEDVQIVQDKLIVITRNQLSNRSGDEEKEEEVHGYTFDLETLKLENNQELLSIPRGDEESFSRLSMMNDNLNVEPEKYFLISKVVMEQGVLEESHEEYEGTEMEVNEAPNNMIATEQSIFVYDYETAKMEELNLPNELESLLESARVTVQNNLIYFMNQQEGSLEVTSYNIETEQIDIEQTFNLNRTSTHEPFIKINQDRLYLITASSEDIGKDIDVMIASLSTGELLYEGKIEVTEKDNSTDYELFINDIDTK
ncbi:hypothetical protein SAMN05216389_10499 [Oceanobacillus limi]|uniref:Uncharacterized protein n=1 Tax=Oceanobacillus limi TaxID=930131 RepID=A0A1I0AYL1_9BACI|nr:hypothetical protein [Oceanobacillus limi]SES99540.1 hypothetical protein SAMN05216389_10499 [Oceanobacillus limi]